MMICSDKLRRYLERYHNFEDTGSPFEGPLIDEEIIAQELDEPSGHISPAQVAELLDAAACVDDGEPVYLWYA